jgi:hypothetical protein
MNRKLLSGCVVGAFVVSAAFLAQAGPQPDFDGTAWDNCVGNGDKKPAWDTVPHNGGLPYYWCCTIQGSLANPLSEQYRWNTDGTHRRDALPVGFEDSCKNHPP